MKTKTKTKTTEKQFLSSLFRIMTGTKRIYPDAKKEIDSLQAMILTRITEIKNHEKN